MRQSPTVLYASTDVYDAIVGEHARGTALRRRVVGDLLQRSATTEQAGSRPDFHAACVHCLHRLSQVVDVLSVVGLIVITLQYLQLRLWYVMHQIPNSSSLSPGKDVSNPAVDFLRRGIRSPRFRAGKFAFGSPPSVESCQGEL